MTNKRYLNELQCDICHKRFNFNNQLKMHMEAHKEERNHTCEVCHKSFKTRGVLISHSLIHKGNIFYKVEHGGGGGD